MKEPACQRFLWVGDDVCLTLCISDAAEMAIQGQPLPRLEDCGATGYVQGRCAVFVQLCAVHQVSNTIAQRSTNNTDVGRRTTILNE